MNAERLLAHYERIADAPDAISRLRRFILDLAVRGKLVPQDPNDEPAAELLKRIAKGKAQTVKAMELRTVEELTAKSDGHVRPPIPAGWTRTTLGTVANIVMGQSPPGDTYNKSGEGVPLINGPVEFSAAPFGKTSVNQYTSAPTNFCEEGDLLICVRGSTTGRTNIAGFRACIGRGVAAIQSRFDDVFIRLFIWSTRDAIIEMGRGIAFPSVSRRQIEDLALTLPPLAEQQRIVAKVDELMALCDRLEAARAEREATRDRLAVASLSRLNAPDPTTFHDDARFAVDALSTITARPDQIRQLRQTVLSLAVRGRLSPDGDWQLRPTKLGEIAKLQNGYAFKSEWFSTKGTRLLRNANVGHGVLTWDEEARLPEIKVQEYERFRLHEGDVVLSLDRPFIVTGTKVARITARDLPALLLQRVGRFTLSPALHSDYLFLWINSPHFSTQIDPGRSNGVPHISSKQVESAVIFLPPLAEQSRIVAKVDELMVLCDRMEASLTSGEDTRHRLLDALLDEALAPDVGIVAEKPEQVAAHA